MKTRILWLLLSITGCLYAQTFQERYNAFKQAAEQDYTDFRTKANADYAEFLRSAWTYYEQSPAISNPFKEEPPIVYEDQQDHTPEPILYDDMVELPDPDPQPEPIQPINENDDTQRQIKVPFYGTEMTIRCPQNIFHLPSANKDQLAKAWEKMATKDYNNLLHDCLSARKQYNLCDWAYLSFIQQVANTVCLNPNDAVLMSAFIYANSGYQMRMAITGNGQLVMLIGSKYVLYDRPYYVVEGRKFFPIEPLQGTILICQGTFEKEKPLSLLISSEQYLASNQVTMQQRQAKSGLHATCAINKNLIDFYNKYPTGQYGEDFGTRWAAYANVPMDKSIQETLYPQLGNQIKGLSETEAANKILNWMQTAFVYEYDDKVWGGDRAFFPSETLYYPYCDCEDRAILFSRIIRDLLKLDVVLLYFPGHLATAVRFNNDINGDYLVVQNQKYFICDPTCIGAPIGMSCSKGESVKVIMLNNIKL